MLQTICRRSRLLLAMAGLLLPTAVPAQNVQDIGDLSRPADWTSMFDVTSSTPDASLARPKPRPIQLFRVGNSVGLDADDPTSAGPDGLDWIQVSVGNDNPYFDFRRPGDPGGVGFYRLNSQMQVLDNGNTSFAVGMQAVTPAGLDQDGVQNGQTVVSPSLSLHHQLDDGTGLHGFVSKNMALQTTALNEQAHRNVQYGVALQRPLVESGPDSFGNFYVFVEALGRYRYDDAATATPAVWEMVPGLHWRMSDTLWLSGGMLVPVNQAQASTNARLWQLTCSFQY